MSNHSFINEMRECTNCELHQTRTQVVVGDYAKESMCFIGEAPGYYEDKQGRPFVGRSGKLLDSMLEKIGMHRSEVSVLNIIKCRPPSNRTPTKSEMDICGNAWLNTQIKYLRPSLLVTLGSVALRYFFPQAKMTKDKGRVQNTDLGIPLFPIFHPAYILRQGNSMLEEYLSDFKEMQKYIIQTDKGTDPNKQQSILDDFF